MALAPGTLLGPYEIVGLLGAGGMGEVYRARDQRLQRTVAIKILPPSFSRDPDRLRRFEHEARAAGSLNHPNIVAVYDIGAEELSPYIVMEFLEGQTLRDKLVSQLSIDRAIDYATQIAKGLAAAHAKGILHRDLKPENVWITTDGRAKILDFGLAKSTAAGASDGATVTSLQEDVSTPGTVLGTAGYMSPEQVLGQPVDARSDIFSFGSILYEMLAGRRAFQHGSAFETMHAIVHEELPDTADVTPRMPGSLLRILRRCLAKGADERFQSASDLAFALSTWIAGGGPEAGIAPPVATWWRNWQRLAWSAGLLLLLAAAISLGVAYTRPTPQPVQTVRAQLLPPPHSSFSRYQFAASPDGTRVAFVAVDTDGNAALWVRELSTVDTQPLKGTEGAATPFWSADSRRIAFFADGKLRAINIRDGSVETLADAQGRRGGTWNLEGTILFPASAAGPLYRIPDAGGVAVPVTRIRQGRGEAHSHPFFLPDGKHFLYFVRSDDPQGSGIYIGSLDSSSVPIRVPLGLAENAAFASGHLIFVRGRSLMAQPFDLDRLEPEGPAVPIAEGVEPDVGGRPEFSVSQSGLLVFQSEADAPSQLVWFDGSGKEMGTLPGVGFKYPRFSPDGRSLAVSSDDAHDGKYYIWVHDLTRGINTRLTNGGSDVCPVWTKDGKEITYASTDGNIMYTIAADGSGPPQILQKGARMVPNDWSLDGHLVFMDFSKGPPRLAMYFAGDHSVVPFAGESEAQFSPDANWIAYSGLRGSLSGEIFVQPVRGPSRRLQISTAGGGQPRWSHDGKRIFYLAPDKKLMAVTFDPQNMNATAPQPLFQTRIVAFGYDFSQYDVAPDGRFLIASLPANSSSPLTLVTGWTALLREH